MDDKRLPLRAGKAKNFHEACLMQEEIRQLKIKSMRNEHWKAAAEKECSERSSAA